MQWLQCSWQHLQLALGGASWWRVCGGGLGGGARLVQLQPYHHWRSVCSCTSEAVHWEEERGREAALTAVQCTTFFPSGQRVALCTARLGARGRNDFRRARLSRRLRRKNRRQRLQPDNVQLPVFLDRELRAGGTGSSWQQRKQNQTPLAAVTTASGIWFCLLVGAFLRPVRSRARS
jgi:hypothetical protein